MNHWSIFWKDCYPLENLYWRVLHNVFLQIRAASELSGHAPAAKQKDHEEAEGGA